MNVSSRKASFALACCALIALAGCGGSGVSNVPKSPPPPPPTVTLAAIALAPATATLVSGATQQLAVDATFSDASTGVLTSGVTFASSDTAVATVTTGGLATAGTTAGSATITATDTTSGEQATAVLTVTLPTLVSIALTPATLSWAPGASQQLTVTATYSNQTTATLTSGVTFASSNPAVAAVSATGLATAGTTGGATTITATDTATGLAATSMITVTLPPPTVVSIALAPTTQTIAAGAQQRYTVTATYSDQSTAMLVNGVAFASSSTTVATIDATGLATAGNIGGTTTITATYTATGATASAVLKVTPKLVSIVLAPLAQTLAAGATQQLQVTGTFSDSSVMILSAASETFVSQAPAVATVSATGLATVLAGAVGGQTATITATDKQSGISTAPGGSTVLTVSPTPLGSGLVYTGGALAPGISFVPFPQSVNTPLPAPDPATLFTDGTPALKLVITATGGAASGGAFVAASVLDMRAFNALVFWAKASRSQSTLRIQLGDDAGGGANVNFEVESLNVPLSTGWQQYVLPVPDPKRAIGFDGLFSYGDNANGYTLWVADVQYLEVPANVLGTHYVAGDGFNSVGLSGSPPSYTLGQGDSYAISPASNSLIWTLGTVTLNGSPVVPLANGGNLDNDAWPWFALASSNANVAVSTAGVVTGLEPGTASVTGMFAGTAIPGVVPFLVTAAPQKPTTNAVAPTLPASSVIALFDGSGVYPVVPVDNFNENWCGQGATEAVYAVPQGTSVLGYNLPGCTGLGFGDGSMPAHQVNASTAGMTHLHLDVWSSNPPKSLVLQLVGMDGGVGSYTVPALVPETWTSIDEDFSAFTGLTAEDQLDQIGLITSGTSLYIDNLYFHK